MRVVVGHCKTGVCELNTSEHRLRDQFGTSHGRFSKMIGLTVGGPNKENKKQTSKYVGLDVGLMCVAVLMRFTVWVIVLVLMHVMVWCM